MPRNLIRQFEQVRGTYTFFYDMFRQYAEQAGRHYFTGTLSVVSGSTTVIDSSTTFEEDELGNFIVIDSGAESGVYQLTVCSGSLNAEVAPAISGTNASASYRRHYYQNLEDDLNYLRKMLQLVIGEDSWYDEPNTDLRNMAYLIPKRPNYLGETTQYVQRSGAVSFSLSDIDQTGRVSSNNPAAYYTDNISSTSPGATVRFTDDNTMVISVTGGFYPADIGYLRVYKDSALVGELDLSSVWTSDGCVYEEEESDVGNNPDHTAAGGLDIFNLTNRRCMNDSVDGYGYFWPPYQIASMNCTLSLDEGFTGQIYIQHSSGGSEQNYTYSSFWVDTSSQSISPLAPTVVSGTNVLKYLSGIPYFDTGSQFTISGTNSDILFDEGYRTNSPMTFYLSQFNTSNISPTYNQIGLSTPLDISDTIDGSGGYGTTFSVGSGNFRDLDARAQVRYYNVFTSSQSGDSAAGIFRIDTYGTTSTNLVEYFDDEHKRYKGTENFNDITLGDDPDNDSAWDEIDNILSIPGLVVYNGTLKYPTINHSLYKPSGPNYSSASGDFYYYRIFIASGAFTQGALTFSGWSNALGTIQGSDVEVHMRYPNCSDYGNGNSATWQDLSVDQQNYGGDGCLGAGSSGSVVVFSFGTTSSSSFGNRVIMRIKFNSNVTALSTLTFSPIL